MTVPFIDLQKQYARIRDDVGRRMQAVLDHGQYILGPEVAEMEEALAAMAGSRHCISVASGTEALLIALMAREIGPGDEVIVPAFTFAATAEVVALVGATPVLADVEPDTANIAVPAIRTLISDRTRAIIPVGLYGQPPDMDEIVELADQCGATVIEDAAQSFGAAYRGRRSCALSEIGCTSFFPSKPLGCYGDGGAIFCDDDGLAQACREIRVHGQSGRYHHTRIGVGGRMDTLQCAVILAKLEVFEEELALREAIGRRYNDLCDQAGVTRVAQRGDRSSAFAQYTVLADDRDDVARRLGESGIPTAVHYPKPLNRQPAYAAISRSGDLSNSEALSHTVLSLPMHPYLDPEVQDRIVDALVAATRSNAPAEA
jgi:UDP-2-acetamido-2-deoxy-ribo-hexuluronate aminotransferase